MATEKLRPLELAAWQGFLVTHDRIMRSVQQGLEPMNVSLAEYSVLALLGEVGQKGMRMSDLAERRLMSTGGFTRLADRLEHRGLIERRRSTVDGRSLEAALTGEGRAVLRKAWRQHYRDIRELFLDRLADDDLRHLADIWARLAAAPR